MFLIVYKYYCTTKEFTKSKCSAKIIEKEDYFEIDFGIIQPCIQVEQKMF